MLLKHALTAYRNLAVRKFEQFLIEFWFSFHFQKQDANQVDGQIFWYVWRQKMAKFILNIFYFILLFSVLLYVVKFYCKLKH